MTTTDVVVLLALFLFGMFYASLMRYLWETDTLHGHTAAWVALGVGVVVGGYTLATSVAEGLLLLACFGAAGGPMVAEYYSRQQMSTWYWQANDDEEEDDD